MVTIVAVILQYSCKDCKDSKVLHPKSRYTETEKAKILRAYNERMSMRGIKRVLGVSPIKHLPDGLRKKPKIVLCSKH